MQQVVPVGMRAFWSSCTSVSTPISAYSRWHGDAWEQTRRCSRWSTGLMPLTSTISVRPFVTMTRVRSTIFSR